MGPSISANHTPIQTTQMTLLSRVAAGDNQVTACGVDADTGLIVTGTNADRGVAVIQASSGKILRRCVCRCGDVCVGLGRTPQHLVSRSAIAMEGETGRSSGGRFDM